ncbi:MAG: hypothetical protein PHN69_07910 [Candidatus Pacebacteria bacterium]|nr:hypothetical protein [Candidatus Paceibacterota bacterium]
MAHFREIVERLRDMILSFKGPINIVICHLDLDSLVAAFAIKYYIHCIPGNVRYIDIFYQGDMNDPLISNICKHFHLPYKRMKPISKFRGGGQSIFIDFVGELGIPVSNIRPSVIIGNVKDEVVHSHDKNIIIFGSHVVSASAIMFNIICESGYLQFKERGYENLLFLLAIAVEHDTEKTSIHASKNMSILGRIIHLIGFRKFHDFIDKLPKSILNVKVRSS